MVVSHYSTFDVFIFCALFSWIAILITDKLPFFKNFFKSPSKEENIWTSCVNCDIGLWVIVVYSCFHFSDQTFISFVSRLVHSFQSGFSNIGSRGNTVSDFVSPNLYSVSLIYKIDYFVSTSVCFVGGWFALTF